MAVRLAGRVLRDSSVKQIVRKLHSGVVACKNLQFNLSDIGEGIREVTVKTWHVKVDDKVEQFDNICEVESDKATVNITSRYDGVVKKLYYNIDDVALVGKPLIDIEVEEEEDEVKKESVPEESLKEEENLRIPDNEVNVPEIRKEVEFLPVLEEPKVWDKSLATPAVRRIAIESNIKLHEVRPTGKNGRVLKEDILNYIHNKSTMKTEELSCRTEKIRGVTKFMVKTMTKANSIPSFCHVDEVDVTKLMDIRKRINELTDSKMTYLPFIMKAFSRSLVKYPILNSSVDETCENITYKPFHNIGMAVDTPQGLLVPNVKNVQSLSLQEISKEIKRLQDAGLKGTLTVQDLKDGTISISNIGALNGIQGIPVILPPEVVISVLGKIQKLPRYDQNEQVVAAHILNITTSADHRIIDGATVARFVSLVKKYLENPELLMLEL